MPDTPPPMPDMPLGIHPGITPPFHAIGEYLFQNLCRDLFGAEPNIATCEVYGNRGQAQFGIDLLAQRRDGDGLEVGQCKCYLDFPVPAIGGATDEFLRHWDEHWAQQNVKRFVLFVASDLTSRQHQDEILKQINRFRELGVIYEAWSAAIILSKLRPHPGIVAAYCQPANYWIPIITGTAQQPDQNSSARFGTRDSRQTQTGKRLWLLDHGSFINTRLAHFVGRETELAEIRRLIAEKQTVGGYLTITGQAGQGKSSIIARLVADADPTNTPHHFIPSSPGREYQLNILRDLIARLIRKYQLPDSWMADDPLAGLTGRFPLLLTEIADRGGKEVLFIDGLDQLREEVDGQRDLSFLPTAPPPGIVFVLGTRPDDTLRPLVLQVPLDQYKLPSLSRDDFNRVLAHHHVALERALADRFYNAMQANALYLELAARELAEAGTQNPLELVQGLTDNPDHLYSIATDRLKRDRGQWQTVIYPLLGILMVAQEPLSAVALRQVLEINHANFQDGMQRLGGLVVDIEGGYELYHQKFRDYLREDPEHPRKEFIFASAEEAQLHRRLADWCDQGTPAKSWRGEGHDAASIARQNYAEAHYIFHLYYGGDRARLEQLLEDDPTAEVLRTLREVTENDPGRGVEVILAYLLPRLISPKRDSAESSSIEQYYDSQLLRSWIYQYAPAAQVAVRDRVLNELVTRLKASPQQSICWAIWEIGYRRPDVVDALWVAAQLDDLRGDTALATLSGLGCPPEARSRLLSMLHARISRRWNYPLQSALSQLADPASIEPIRNYLEQPTRITLSADELEGGLHLLARIADSANDDPDRQEYIWSQVTHLYRRHGERLLNHLFRWNDIIPLIDNSRAVYESFGWANASVGKSSDPAANFYGVSSILASCVRPKQLLGWASVKGPALLTALEHAACQNTKFTGYAETSESIEKEAAWETLLCLGHAALLKSFDAAVLGEAGDFDRAHTLDLLACFRLDKLPPAVIQWVAEPYDRAQDRGHSDGTLSLRRAAIRLAVSAASREAFDALRRCGLTEHGNGLMETMEALAAISLVLARAGEDSIPDALLETVAQGTEAQQTAAAGALHALAAEGDLPAAYARHLAMLVFDSSRNTYQRSELLIALKWFHRDEIPEELLTELPTWAKVNDWLGARALFLLAAQDRLLEHPDLLTTRLKLQLTDAGWALDPDASLDEWNARVLGLLYRQHPDLFTPLILEAIERLEIRTVNEILHMLEQVHSDAVRPLPDVLVRGLLRRAHGQQTRNYAETEAFNSLARLAPVALAGHAWADYWYTWRPTARLALAEALSNAIYPDPPTGAAAAAHLIELTNDSDYAIRRSAYRGLRMQLPARLRDLCAEWGSAQSISARQRAAEAWAWLESGTGSDPESYFQRLRIDPEPIVRETVQRVRKERRKRLWGDIYVARLQAIDGGNDEILSAWRYGSALAKVGDDSHIAALQQHLHTANIPPHVYHWLVRILRETKANWDKVTREWPKLATSWEFREED